MIAFEPTSDLAAVRAHASASAAQAPMNRALPIPHECLTWRLGAEEYGIDILRVQEIRGYEPPTGIANAPSFIRGVLNLRGVVVPVVELRIKFGDHRPVYDAKTATIVLNVRGRTVGVVVDSVCDVVELRREDILPAPSFRSVPVAECIAGIGQISQGEINRLLVLLDIERLLCGPDFGLLDEDRDTQGAPSEAPTTKEVS